MADWLATTLGVVLVLGAVSFALWASIASERKEGRRNQIRNAELPGRIEAWKALAQEVAERDDDEALAIKRAMQGHSPYDWWWDR